MAHFHKTKTGVHYSRSGKSNQAVVFVHGFLEDLRMWDDFIHRVRDYSVIKVDLPGFGQSSTKAEISISDYADAVKKVLDAEKIKQIILVGHSMGGYTAMAFAKKYPDLLKGLCLFHSHPYADTKEGKAKRLKSAKFVETHGGQAYTKTTIPNLFAPSFRKKHQNVVNHVIKLGQENSDKGIIAAIHAMKNRKDTSDVLAQINCPVQFIIGTEDGAIPAELSLKQTTLPDIADVHILKGIGHMGHLEARRRTVKAVRGFIKFVG